MPSDTDALVLRYLHKRGYAAAFRALLTESGATDEFDPAEPAPRAALGTLATLCCDSASRTSCAADSTSSSISFASSRRRVSTSFTTSAPKL